MGESKLFIGRGHDADTQRGNVPRMRDVQCDTDVGCIHNDKAVASVGRIDAQRSETINVQFGIHPIHERGHIGDLDPLCLSVAAFGFHPNKAAWSLECEVCDGLLHRYDARVQDGRGYTHRIGTGHGRRISRLHDDEAHVRFRMLWWYEQIHVPENTATRLV